MQNNDLLFDCNSRNKTRHNREALVNEHQDKGVPNYPGNIQFNKYQFNVLAGVQKVPT